MFGCAEALSSCSVGVFSSFRRGGRVYAVNGVMWKGVNRVAVVPEDISYPVPAHWLYRTQHSLPVCVCVCENTSFEKSESLGRVDSFEQV